MATGYTADIKDGISFNKFVWRCARAFGALIHMRDHSLGDKLSYPEYDNYYEEKLNAAKQELLEVKNTTDEQILKEIDIEFNKTQASLEAGLNEMIDLKSKYEKMLDQVNKWVPPSQDHVGLKKFMIEQITSSIEFDCSDDYINRRKAELLSLKKESISKYKKNKIDHIKHDIEYYSKEHEKNVQNVESKIKWLNDLKESVAID